MLFIYGGESWSESYLIAGSTRGATTCHVSCTSHICSVSQKYFHVSFAVKDFTAFITNIPHITSLIPSLWPPTLSQSHIKMSVQNFTLINWLYLTHTQLMEKSLIASDPEIAELMVHSPEPNCHCLALTRPPAQRGPAAARIDPPNSIRECNVPRCFRCLRIAYV